MIIIFDLDGTLIDSSDRLFCLFQFLISDSNLTKQQYWELKRNKVNHEMILSQYFPFYSFNDFNKIWMSKIESKEYIDLDRLYDDTIYVLSELKKTHELYLLTARQSYQMLLYELKKLGILSFFDKILATENVATKKELMHLHNIPKGSMFVTDMGKDIFEGNEFGLITIGIDHGFMTKEKLLEYNPSKIIAKLSDLFILEKEL